MYFIYLNLSFNFHELMQSTNPAQNYPTKKKGNTFVTASNQ